MKKTSQETPRPQKGGLGRVVALLFVSMIVLAAVVGGGGYLYANHAYTKSGPETVDGTDRTVLIPPGSSVATIASKLFDAGAIEATNQFKIAVRATNTTAQLKAGEYAIPSGASLKDIVERLVDGKSILHAITIPEGLTSAMILERLAQSEVLSGDLPSVTPAEGVLLPDTYMVHRDDTREAIVARMVQAQRNLMDELWANRQPGLPFETREEALVLASVVEKETGLASERPQVAAVFVNRLRRNMRLESDPTIIYGLTQGVPLGRGLRRSEIDRKTEHNTYQIDGLPPTPICNPGRDAIAAVLNPPTSKALFFVADGSGGHAFADTYSEHLRNVAQWRQIERSASQTSTTNN